MAYVQYFQADSNEELYAKSRECLAKSGDGSLLGSPMAKMTATAQYGIVYRAGNSNHYAFASSTNRACHAQVMAGLDRLGGRSEKVWQRELVVQVAGSVDPGNNRNAAICMQFLDYMLNRSMFKEAFPDKDVVANVTKGWITHAPDMPAPFVHAAYCMARQTNEGFRKISVWATLVNTLKVDERMAHMLCPRIACDLQVCRTTFSGDHGWSAMKGYLEHVVSGTLRPVLREHGESWREATTYTGTDDVFGPEHLSTSELLKAAGLTVKKVETSDGWGGKNVREVITNEGTV